MSPEKTNFSIDLYKDSNSSADVEGELREKKIIKEKVDEEKLLDANNKGKYFLAVLNDKEDFRERIKIKKDGSLDVLGDVTELPGPEILRGVRHTKYTVDGLRDFTKDISTINQNLHFSFGMGKKGEWIEYKVYKEDIVVGDEVVWDNLGQIMWLKPKKITAIQEDKKSGRKYAMVEGEKTGFPIDELTKRY